MQKIESDVSLDALRESVRENNNLANKVNRIRIINKTSLLLIKVVGF